MLKEKEIRNIQKQKNNAEGQKKMFERIRDWPFVQLKTTELKHAKGIIYQKGVDVQISSDMLHFAHTNSYDIALILGGDADLVESIKLVRNGLGKIVVVVAYYDPTNNKLSTISPDLIKEADYFLNLRDLSEGEVLEISDLRREII